MAVSVFSITDALARGMIERRWGRIVTIGSSGIEQPISGLSLSNSVRAAGAGWSKTLSAVLAPHGVTVNMILPGRIDTDRARELDDIRARNNGLEVAAVQVALRREIPGRRTVGQRNSSPPPSSPVRCFGSMAALSAACPARRPPQPFDRNLPTTSLCLFTLS